MTEAATQEETFTTTCLIYRSYEELVASENPHQDYICSWTLGSSDHWHCKRCRTRQMPNINRYVYHDRFACQRNDHTREYYGPLCPHCAEVVEARVHQVVAELDYESW